MDLPLNRILRGDCLELLKALPDESVDSVVTDPPYGLGDKDPDAMDIFMYVLGATLDTGGDFMGRDWELPSIQIWREVYRVLKPGGYVVAFGGCYDDQTEVLTSKGWVPFPEVTGDEEFASLNLGTHQVEWQRAKEVVRERHDGPMHHYQTAKVDLLVTPNHKMLVCPAQGDFKLMRADDHPKAVRVTKTSNGLAEPEHRSHWTLPSVERHVTQGRYETVPAREIPLEVWLPLFGLYLAQGSTTFSNSVVTGNQASYKVSLCHFDEGDLDELEDLLAPYFSVCRYPEEGKLQINDKQLAVYLKAFGHAWEKYIPTELKRLPPEQLKLFWEWYSRGDGDRNEHRAAWTTSSRLRDDWQEVAMLMGYSLDWATCKPKSNEYEGRMIESKRPCYRLGVHRVQAQPSIYRDGKAKTIVPAEVWDGKTVYCVELPKHHTLYVRRNGKAVWCGNTRTFDLISIGLRMAGFECRDTISREFPEVELPILQWIQSQGMPKSHAIGKAIDKKLGKKREVIGQYQLPPDHARPNKDLERWRQRQHEADARRKDFGHGLGDGNRDITAPGSDEAAEWEGWGSALKPSWEPILLFRKPFKGTLADNVLEHGTGGINIDATRVRHASAADFEAHKKGVEAIKEKGGSRDKSWKNSSDLSKANDVKEGGRWPANCLLEHSALCKKLGTQEIAPHPQGPDRFQKTDGGGFSEAYGNQLASSEPEVAPIWQCAEGCPVREMNEQSGERPSTLTGRADPNTSHKHPGHEMNPNSAFLGERSHLSRVYADGGGAARFFTQFEGDSEGRWPSNVVLQHAEGCKRVGSKRVKGTHAAAAKGESIEGKTWRTRNKHTYGACDMDRPVMSHVGLDGLEEVDAWECVEGCPVKALDSQSGVTRSGGDVKGTEPSAQTKAVYGEASERAPHESYADEGGASRFFSQFQGDAPQGRWPGNVVLQHAEGCTKLGTKKVKGITGGTKPPIRKRSVYAEAGGYNTQGKEQTPVKGYSAADGNEEVEAWECVDGCPVKALDAQGIATGSHTAGNRAAEVNHVTGSRVYGEFIKPMRNNPDYHADEGGVSRFFSQFDGVPFKYVPKANRKEAGCGEFEVQHITVKPLSLIRWLVKLVTRKEGVVLDLYCGSGTTPHAAVLEGMNFIGMERDEASHAEAVRRLEIVLRREEERRDAEELFEFSMGRG